MNQHCRNSQEHVKFYLQGALFCVFHMRARERERAKAKQDGGEISKLVSVKQKGLGTQETSSMDNKKLLADHKYLKHILI